MESLNIPVRTRDGLQLHLQHWQAVPSIGSVLIVHGLGEHIGRYEHVALALNRAGWRVAGHDQRGHGRSPGARGALATPDSLLADLALVIDRVRASHPGPLLLLGHSMGGVVAARFVAEALSPSPAAWSRPVDGLVLSSPALDSGIGALQKMMLDRLGSWLPNVALGNGLKPEWVSRDPAVVRAYIDDPLNHDRITFRLARFIVGGGALALQRATAWRTPTLLLWAGADLCVAPAGSAAFAAAAPADVLTAQRFPALFHEIFNEPEQAEVLAALTGWLARF